MCKRSFPPSDSPRCRIPHAYMVWLAVSLLIITPAFSRSHRLNSRLTARLPAACAEFFQRVRRLLTGGLLCPACALGGNRLADLFQVYAICKTQINRAFFVGKVRLAYRSTRPWKFVSPSQQHPAPVPRNPVFFSCQNRFFSRSTLIFWPSNSPENSLQTPWKPCFLPEKCDFFLQNGLQSSKSVIYYVSVARQKRRSSEADIKCKEIWWSWFWKTSGFEKNRKKFTKRFAKFKKCDILCFCCASKTTEQRGWYKAQRNLLIVILKNLRFEKKSKKISKTDLQSSESVIYYVSVTRRSRVSWLKIE